MKEEYNTSNNRFNYQEFISTDLPATSASYWDPRCGKLITSLDDLENQFSHFLSSLTSYKSHEFFNETLTGKLCMRRFLDALHIEIPNAIII